MCVCVYVWERQKEKEEREREKEWEWENQERDSVMNKKLVIKGIFPLDTILQLFIKIWQMDGYQILGGIPDDIWQGTIPDILVKNIK
jgi:hypothetical protein